MQLVHPRSAGITLITAFVTAVLLAGSNDVLAVPSFARQTGLACEACHTVFPELTPFGRQFKLNGYLIDNLPQVKGVTPDKDEALLLNWLPPLSLQFITSYTKFKTALPDTGPSGGVSQNGTVQFPEQASLFYAGRIAPKLGGFIQITYDNNSDSFGWDNTDIRFADLTTLGQDKPLTWGVSANNSPTVQDPWNSTPAWHYPFSQTSSVAPPQVATTQLQGIGNGTVAGLTAYGYWNNLVYLELGGYAAAPHAINNVPLNSAFPNSTVHGFSPYWRVAVQPQWGRNSLEVGLLGFDDQLTPAGSNVTSGPTDEYRDTGLDAEYQYIADEHIFSAELLYVYEKQTLNATLPSDASNTLRSFSIGGSYFYQRKLGGSLGYFSTTGNTNPALYATSTGSPDTTGYAIELDYLPWQNVKLALQYTIYTKFNGSSSNYDGTGRNASDNNTLYIFAWFAF